MDTDDGDITLGPGRLLGLFFMLVVVCGVFFAIGYSLGKTSAREQAVNDKVALSASLTAPAVGDPSTGKPSAVVSARNETQATVPEETQDAKSAPDMTFYNAVKQSDRASQQAAPETAQPAASKTPKAATADPKGEKTVLAAEVNSPRPATEAKTDTKVEMKPAASAAIAGTFVVQIAAVSREEDAAALAGALRKKSYSVFVVNNPAVHDKLYHVQVGPFETLQDAEAMKAKLTGEGYNPIVKRS